MSDLANPKDAAGRAKLPLHLWPATATAYGAIGFLEGQLKYGRTNWRATPVYASVYYEAAMRHLNAWMENEDFTDEGGPHLGNALACIAIIVDAHVNGTLLDDRNFVPDSEAYKVMVEQMIECSKKLKARFGDRTPKNYDKRDMAPHGAVVQLTAAEHAKFTAGEEPLSKILQGHLRGHK